MLSRGPVRGGSGGSIDPPRILDNIKRGLKIGLLSEILHILTPLSVIPGVLNPQSEIPNMASVTKYSFQNYPFRG